jgi:hypothetical protein
MAKNIIIIRERVIHGTLRQDDSLWLVQRIAELTAKLVETENLYKQTIEARDTWRSKALMPLASFRKNA